VSGFPGVLLALLGLAVLAYCLLYFASTTTRSKVDDVYRRSTGSSDFVRPTNLGLCAMAVSTIAMQADVLLAPAPILDVFLISIAWIGGAAAVVFAFLVGTVLTLGRPRCFVRDDSRRD
jgi:hypothetical protein